MVKVEIDRKQLLALEKAFLASERRARYKGLYYTGERLRMSADYIMRTWPKMDHPLSAHWRAKYHRPRSKRLFQSVTGKAKRPYERWRHFLRFKIDPGNLGLETGWGSKHKRRKRGVLQPASFSNQGYYQEVGRNIEEGQSYVVTDLMRRKIAASTQGDVTLRVGTTLKVKPRPVWEPAYQRINVTQVFRENFNKALLESWQFRTQSTA